MDYKALWKRWKSFWDNPIGRAISNVLRYGFIGGVMVYLAYQLSQMNWREMWQAFPTTPWFYVFLILAYFTLPMLEQLIYRMSLRFSFWEGFRVFIKKKILNSDVYPYSGEAYFFMWGRENLKEDSRTIFHVVKDNNIISSFASTLMAILLLGIFMYFGKVSFFDLFHISFGVFLGVVGLALVIIAVAIYYRKYIIGMGLRKSAKVFGIHVLRVVLVHSFELLQWMVALPHVPLNDWLVFLSSRIIINRLPVPAPDFVFIGASIGISQDSEITAVMMASVAISKILNLLLYTFFASKDRLVQRSKAAAMAAEQNS